MAKMIKNVKHNKKFYKLGTECPKELVKEFAEKEFIEVLKKEAKKKEDK
jgi:hypothetical protein